MVLHTLSAISFFPSNNFFSISFKLNRIKCTICLCKKNLGHPASLTGEEHLSHYRAYFKETLLSFCKRAHSSAVGMRNLILRNHLKNSFISRQATMVHVLGRVPKRPWIPWKLRQGHFHHSQYPIVCHGKLNYMEQNLHSQNQCFLSDFFNLSKKPRFQADWNLLSASPHSGR